MKKIFYLMAAVAFMSGLTACDNQDELTASGASNGSVLTMNGNCDIYTLQNSENADWTITSCPDWVTPVQMSGSADSDIQLYVESNRLTPLREGNVTIKYANGRSRITRVDQTNKASSISAQRSYAAGWGFDIRTYNDIRGVRDQIFNTQKLIADSVANYYIIDATGTDLQFYYGEDASKLQSNITANMNIDIKYNAFKLNLDGTFGRNTLSNSKHIFSWMRYSEAIKEASVYADASYAAKNHLFTADFAAMRQEVIDSKGSEASIQRLIELYGTHYIGRASLGGCFDYYYSTEMTKSMTTDSIQGAIKFGFNQKFNLDVTGNGQYKSAFNNMKTETIEKFEVKGGEAMTLARSIDDGSISETSVETWKETIDDAFDETGKLVAPGKLELISFGLVPIQNLFPITVSVKITEYLDKLYYSELPLTRSQK